MVQFHLVHYSFQVPTWWWSDSSLGLMCAEGICTGFVNIVLTLGCRSVKFLFVCESLGFAPGFAYQSSSRNKLRQEFIIGNHRLSALSPTVSPLRWFECINAVLTLVILVIYSLKKNLFAVIQVGYFIVI